MRQWVIGKTHHDYCRKRKYPLSIADKRQAVIDQCVAEKRIVTLEELWHDKAGQPLYYLRMFCPVLDAEGRVTHVIGFGNDITALKKTEEKLRHALEEVKQLKDRLHAENVYLQEEIKLHHNFGEVIGTSEALKKVLRKVEQVAATEATVLILGETGTGKELIARAVHGLSARQGRPLVKMMGMEHVTWRWPMASMITLSCC